MKYDYTFGKKHLQKIDGILKKYKSITTAEIIATVRERAINAINDDLQHAAAIECKPYGVTLFVERSYVMTLYAAARERELTSNERLSILAILQCNYHDSGKIAGMQSIDSTCNCEFCKRMHNSTNENCVSSLLCRCN